MKLLACVCVLLVAVAALAKESERICESCFDIDETIYPFTMWQTVSGSTAGQPNNEYAYGFCAVGGNTYTFTFCSNGGSASFDTGLSIQGPDNCGSYLACNDDFCSLQSELVWTAPGYGYADHILVVDGYSSNAGSYTLAYYGLGCIVPTETLTWSAVKSLY